MASLQWKPSRYAHGDGHTDLAVDDSVTEYPGQFLTCGADGEIRIWNGLDDDSPVAISLGDCAMGLACRPRLLNGSVPNSGRFVAGNEDTHGLHSFDLPDGTPDGILTRFTADVTCASYSKDGAVLAAGARDFQIKVFKNDSVADTLSGHSGPILSLTFDPSGTRLASSSCDGSVKIWDMSKEPASACIKTLADVFPKSNDFGNSPTLCRLCWSPDGSKLLVPAIGGVKVFEASSLDFQFTLTDSALTIANVAVFAPGAKHVAVASVDGVVVVFDFADRSVVAKLEPDKKVAICAASWNPTSPPNKSLELIICDVEGQLGACEFHLGVASSSKSKRENVEDFRGLFEDDDNEAFVAASQAAERGDLDDKEDEAHVEEHLDALSREDGAISRADSDVPLSSRVIYSGPKLPTPQQSFQPSATPRHLSNRFMVWNSVGVVTQHKTENAIEVEFHDASIHHAIHVDNDDNFIMADLNENMVAFASEAEDGNASKLKVLHIASWDGAKDWSISMPEGEEIEAVAVGFTWVAVASNKRHLRFFSAAGNQREMMTLSGPVVCMAGFKSELLVAYHDGVGVLGDQKLMVSHFRQVGLRPYSFRPTTFPLPLSPKTTLEWLGFSLEGSPVSVDSDGVVRLMRRSLQGHWLPIVETRKNLAKSDNYFIVAVSERDAHIRCIFCKACGYPAVLPKPLVQTLPISIPLADTETDKGISEAAFWSAAALESNSNTEMVMQEHLIKLVALACKSGRDFRATETASLFPSAVSMQFAIKYATRMGKINLASRFGEIALRRRQEEALGSERYEEEDEPPNSQMSLFEDSPPRGKEPEGLQEEMQEEEETESVPLLQLDQRSKPLTPLVASAKDSQDISRKGNNPFRRHATLDGSDAKSSNVFAALAQPSKKSTSLSSGRFSKTAAPKSANDIIRPPPVKRKAGSQTKKATLFARSVSEPEDAGGKNEAPTMTSTPAPKDTQDESPFSFWRRCNLEAVMADFPDGDDAEDDEAVTQHCVKKFRELPTVEKKEWIAKFNSQKDKGSRVIAERDGNAETAEDSGTNSKKRKLENKEEEFGAIKKNGSVMDKEQKPPSVKNKLASYAFSSDD